MIPDFNTVPVEEVLWMKREELMREFEEIRLVRAARQANPGLVERAWLWLGQFLVRAGEKTQARVMAPRQTYLDSAARFAA